MNKEFNLLKDFIQNNSEEYVRLQTLLTKTPALAPENGGVGEIEKCNALEAFLKEHGFTNIERFDSKDERAKNGVRPNLVVTIQGKNNTTPAGNTPNTTPTYNCNDFTIWIIAHLDVVPVGDINLWKTNPWKVTQKNGVLYGRGVEDNQQGLCSAFAALWACVKLGIKPIHTVKLLFASDEEVGSKYGVIHLINKTSIFKKGDVFIIPDGGDVKGETIEVAEKNILWIEFTTKGKQCHASRPDCGKNACLAGSALCMNLSQTLKQTFTKTDSLFTPNCSTFEPTMRAANVQGVNIIPAQDVLCFDMRILPCYTIQEVISVVEDCIKKISAEYNVNISYRILQKSESCSTKKDAPIVQKLKDALKATRGITARTIGIGGGTVAAELRNKGFDAVVWSTLDETAHMPNEYCVLDNLINDAITLAYLITE